MLFRSGRSGLGELKPQVLARDMKSESELRSHEIQSEIFGDLGSENSTIRMSQLSRRCCCWLLSYLLFFVFCLTVLLFIVYQNVPVLISREQEVQESVCASTGTMCMIRYRCFFVNFWHTSYCTVRYRYCTDELDHGTWDRHRHLVKPRDD